MLLLEALGITIAQDVARGRTVRQTSLGIFGGPGHWSKYAAGEPIRETSETHDTRSCRAGCHTHIHRQRVHDVADDLVGALAFCFTFKVQQAAVAQCRQCDASDVFD